MSHYAEDFIQSVRDKVGPTGNVIGAVSGGVDSTVAAVLMNKAIGHRFHAILVDNGCLRKDEATMVLRRLRDDCGIDLHCVDASERFLALLKGVTDPEQKRKIIGATFIDVFQEEADRIERDVGKCEFLLQGTLYPDVIESVSYKGPSATIKTHHNVGGLPATMKLKLIEPLRELFKDEVRELGIALGLDEMSVWYVMFCCKLCIKLSPSFQVLQLTLHHYFFPSKILHKPIHQEASFPWSWPCHQDSR